jgi:hypothetical protein
MPYLYEPYELQLLGDFLHTGAQAAGVAWKPTAQAGDSELDSHEVAEVVFMEIIPPVQADGTVEALEQVKLILDEKDYGQYIHLLGTDTYLVTPPKNNAMNGQILAFGVPMVHAVKSGAPLYEGVCPKYAKSVKVETVAGTGGITADYRIRLWGYRYPVQELGRLIGSVGGNLEIRDDRTNRSLIVSKPYVAASWETWTQLPGGLDQAMPKINPLVRYARNANATTANTPYQFRYETGDVALREENMYFPFDIENKALVVKGLGVRAPANLAETFLNINGKDRPKGRIPTTQFLNPIHFGRAYPLYPADFPAYFTIPKFDKPYLIWQDKGYVAVQDNGTSISAGEVTVYLNGLLIEMGR